MEDSKASAVIVCWRARPSVNGQNESQYESEMRIAAAIQRGCDDMAQGRVHPWKEARQLVDSIREPYHNGTLRAQMAQQELPHAYGEESLTVGQIENLCVGYAQAMCGECQSAEEMLAEIRKEYGV